MGFRLVTAPTSAAEPLQLADVSTWLRGPHDDESSDIQALIVAAREEAERENGRVLAVSTWEKALDEWPDENVIELLEPLKVVAPATSAITSFTYKDSDGTVHVMAEGTDFIVDADSRPGRVALPYGVSWPSATLWPVSPIKVQFTAGLDPDDVPGSLKQFMKVFIQSAFDHGGLIISDQVAANPFVQNLARRDGLTRF
jgi:uncharacterized phiE125 gp8 family phage protein